MLQCQCLNNEKDTSMFKQKRQSSLPKSNVSKPSNRKRMKKVEYGWGRGEGRSQL